MSTILVKIASYRDSELLLTIESCLSQARDPQHLRFAIVNQVCPVTDSQLDSFRDDDRFRIMQVGWQQSRGLGWARRLTDRFYQDESFFLQIDSHMRFAKDWDVNLIDQWHEKNDARGVISAFPPEYSYDAAGKEVYGDVVPGRIVTDGFIYDFIPVLIGEQVGDTADPGLLVAGGLQFGPGVACQEVPQLGQVFCGDETAHSLRLFTHGYNVYLPTDQPIYHLYFRQTLPGGAKLPQEDFSESESLRLKHLYRLKKNVDLMKELLHGNGGEHLGDVRSRQEFMHILEEQFTVPHRLKRKRA